MLDLSVLYRPNKYYLEILYRPNKYYLEILYRPKKYYLEILTVAASTYLGHRRSEPRLSWKWARWKNEEKKDLVTSAEPLEVVKMKLSSSVFSLGMAGLAVATPVPVHLDIRADKYWYMNGWGNPNCQGSFLWAYQGNGNACVNVPAMAASVSFGISPGVAELGLVNLPTCGLARSALVAGTPDATTSDFSPTVQLIEVNGDGDSGLEKRQVHTSCNNSKEGVWAFRIRWV